MTTIGTILFIIFSIFLFAVCLLNWGFLHIALPGLIALAIVKKVRKHRRNKKCCSCNE